MREDEFLEGIDLILQCHKVGDSLITLVGVVDRLQTNVFLVLESACSLLVSDSSLNPASRTVELRMLAMERKLGHQVVDVLGDKRRISSRASSIHGTARQTLEPAGVGLCLFQNDRVALLEDFVYGNERLEGLNLVG